MAWELAMQSMRGDTIMGRIGAGSYFQSWFALASHPLGPGTAAVRYDRFSTTEHDNIPSDPNTKLAMAWRWLMTGRWPRACR
jgi:hypothetical protein